MKWFGPSWVQTDIYLVTSCWWTDCLLVGCYTGYWETDKIRNTSVPFQPHTHMVTLVSVAMVTAWSCIIVSYASLFEFTLQSQIYVQTILLTILWLVCFAFTQQTNSTRACSHDFIIKTVAERRSIQKLPNKMFQRIVWELAASVCPTWRLHPKTSPWMQDFLCHPFLIFYWIND